MIKRLALIFVMVLAAMPVRAQTAAPAKEPPPLWDVQLGAAFVGTTGNSDTSTLGSDFSLHRRWPIWKLEAAATTVRTTDKGVRTAERYLGSVRGDRKLTDRIDFSTGERAERDRLAGISFRSISDAGLKYALVKSPSWTLDGLTSMALNHEDYVQGDTINHAIAVLQALSRYVFSPNADTTERFTFYPDFQQSDAYRAEAEVAAQAAMNSRLALKFGYLWRYSNAPAVGFVKSDNTATASVVLRWKASTPAP